MSGVAGGIYFQDFSEGVASCFVRVPLAEFELVKDFVVTALVAYFPRNLCECEWECKERDDNGEEYLMHVFINAGKC